ncbi:MAG TPA: periplasmic heavy metal sensor [Thermoanaerobaculia bacterium]|nr:periplasmic heavy metal sensor [Thermoanaerobaculia bacterium]
MTRRIVIGLIAALAVTTLAAAAELPPGKWWRNPQIAQRLALEPEQQARLDAIFHDSASDLIDRRGEIEKLAIALRGELDQRKLDRQNLQRLAAALSQARGRLFERELMMLADMRGVLNDEQWAQLRAYRRHEGPPRRRR